MRHEVILRSRHVDRQSHIEGLRAIAVMGVVVYHFGAEWLPGGFIGVDVFFVISGFLITRSIYRDLERESFSLLDFYVRRARRIFPAMFVVTSASGLVAYYTSYPAQLVAFFDSMLASLTFTGNIYFYYKLNYFSSSVAEIPLLHYWSLGVEEQFYIIYPLLALLMLKWSEMRRMQTLVAIGALSLVSSQVMLSFNPSATFYLLPFRAFELLIGCILASRSMPLASGRWLPGASVTFGLCLIIGGMTLFTEELPFPGLSALVPCLGAALVIWGGNQRGHMLSQLLGRQPFVFVGAISYSLYLVHWPLFVFMGPFLLENLGRFGLLVSGSAISVMLAWLLFRTVEQPVRLHVKYWTAGRILFGATTGTAILFAMSMTTILQKGFPSRFDSTIANMLEWQKYSPSGPFRSGSCFLEPTDSLRDYDADSCLPIHGRGAILLWGDSSVAQLYTGLKEITDHSGISLGQVTSSSCAPILENDVALRPLCRKFNDLAIERIVELMPDLVILGANWDTSLVVMERFAHTLDILASKGVRTVVLGPPPFYKASVPEIIAKRISESNPSRYSDSDLDFDALVAADEAVRSVVAQYSNAQFVSVRASLCPLGRCPMTAGSVPLQFDAMHLTTVGSRFVAHKLYQALPPVHGFDDLGPSVVSF